MWSSASCAQSGVRDRARVRAYAPAPYTTPEMLKVTLQSPASASGTSAAARAAPGLRSTRGTTTTATGSLGWSGSEEALLPYNHISSATVRETLEAFSKVLSAWRAGSIAVVDDALSFCEDYLDSQTLDMVPCFVGCGGVNLFCELLCDPVVFEGRRARAYYINVMSCLIVVLTEVVVRHNNISWYIYDRYPAVFFRLVELLAVAQLNGPALSMLEHLLSVVGPVLEIAKNRALIQLIQSEAPFLLGGLCRVLALLVIPGNALQQSCMPSRHLLYPEVLCPIRRVQRVVDSNVLWLQSRSGLVDRLISLCEVRLREIRVQQGGRTTTVIPPTQPPPAAGAAAGGATTPRPVDLTAILSQLSQIPQGADLDATLQTQIQSFLRQAGGSADLISLVLGRPVSAAAGGTSDEWYDVSGEGEEEEEEEEDGDEEWETDESPPQDESSTDTSDRHSDAEAEGDTEQSTEVLNSIHVPSPRPGFSSSSSFFEAPLSPHGDSGRRGQPLELTPPVAVSVTTAEPVGANIHAVAPPSASGLHSTQQAAASSLSGPATNNPLSAATRVPAPVNPPTASPTAAQPNEAAARVVQELINEEAMIENELNTKIDLNWYYGSVDARERWRLRDLTLVPDRDDTRATYYGFGAVRDDAAVRRFHEANEANIRFLQSANPLSDFTHMSSLFKHQTVDSQSEILYILNVLMSTFYFSDAWYELKRCHWLKRANKIYNISFGLGKGAPLSVDVPRNVDVPAYLRKLPRFQPARAPQTTATATPPPRDATRALPPPQWSLPPFHDMLGQKKTDFAQDKAVQMLQDEDDFGDETEHQHSPDTVRKLELLRGLHSFWNAQNAFESRMLDEGEMPQQAMALCVKVANMLVSSKEDPCVEAAACNVLESYLRTFTHNARVNKDWRGEPVSRIGAVVLQNLLHQRVYNATLVPTLSQSIRPLRRFENTFSLLGELFQYDFANLLTLSQHLDGAVPLGDLNEPCKPVNHSDLLMFAPGREIDAIFETPPLERERNEPFGSVLLRRMYRYGCETNLFVSAMLLSVTPGLRSAYNYAHRPLPGEGEEAIALREDARFTARWVPVHLPSTPNGRVGDLVSGFSRRFAAVRCLSREFAARLSLAVLPFSTPPSSSHTPLVLSSVPLASPAWRAAVAPHLEALMEKLRQLPHRLSPEERPFPHLYSEQDAALLRGERGLQICGPHRLWRLPLFGGSAGVDDEEEARKLSQLDPIAKYLLGEPHKLVFSLLCPLNAETMDSTGRMSVVTTTILTFLREAHMHPEDPEGAIHALLKDIAGLAVPAYRTWRKQSRSHATRHPGRTTSVPSTAASARLGPTPMASPVSIGHVLPPAAGSPATTGSVEPLVAPLVTTHCTCPEAVADPHYRCLAFVTFGVCHPPSAASDYHRQFGGCFFRNLFRLLCVWVGHYWSCQRYVDTIFFYTEVAFAEYKTIALYLLRELPQYFSAPILDDGNGACVESRAVQ